MLDQPMASLYCMSWLGFLSGGSRHTVWRTRPQSLSYAWKSQELHESARTCSRQEGLSMPDIHQDIWETGFGHKQKNACSNWEDLSKMMIRQAHIWDFKQTACGSRNSIISMLCCKKGCPHKTNKPDVFKNYSDECLTSPWHHCTAWVDWVF